MNVGIIGAGKRMRTMFVPILRSLGNDYNLVGFTSRSQKTRDDVQSSMGIRSFTSIKDLAKECDALIICVKPEAAGDVLKQASQFCLPMLTETPTMDPSVLGYEGNNEIAVIEQWPFLPLERFKKMVIDSGSLGKIRYVENDFRTFDYHGIAQLRSYLGFAKPTELFSRSIQNSVSSGKISETPKLTSEQWDVCTISFPDALCLHKFSYNYKVSENRFPQSLRVFGETGNIVSMCWKNKSDDFEMMSLTNVRLGNLRRDDINVERSSSGSVIKITGGNFTWVNPYPDLGDHESAIAHHFTALKNCVHTGSPLLYSYQEGLIDYTIFSAMRQSQVTGVIKFSGGNQ